MEKNHADELVREVAHLPPSPGYPFLCFGQAVWRWEVSAEFPPWQRAALPREPCVGFTTGHRAFARFEDLLCQPGAVGATEVAGCAAALFEVLALLHSRGWSHGYLVPQSLGLTLDGGIVIRDLWMPQLLRGASRAWEWQAPYVDPVLRTSWASTPHRPLFFDQRHDVYAAGALLWHLACGTTPAPAPTGLAQLSSADLAEVPGVAWGIERCLSATDRPEAAVMARHFRECLTQRKRNRSPRAAVVERDFPPLPQLEARRDRMSLDTGSMASCSLPRNSLSLPRGANGTGLVQVPPDPASDSSAAAPDATMAFRQELSPQERRFQAIMQGDAPMRGQPEENAGTRSVPVPPARWSKWRWVLAGFIAAAGSGLASWMMVEGSSPPM